MIFTEDVVIKELIWEYDYTKSQAESIVSHYKSLGKYPELCELIQYRLSLAIINKEKHNV